MKQVTNNGSEDHKETLDPYDLLFPSDSDDEEAMKQG